MISSSNVSSCKLTNHNSVQNTLIHCMGVVVGMGPKTYAKCIGGEETMLCFTLLFVFFAFISFKEEERFI